MKQISDLVNLEKSDDVHNELLNVLPALIEEAVEALDGIMSSIIERIGDSPEAYRGAVCMMTVLSEMLALRDDDQSAELDSFILTYGMPLLFSKFLSLSQVKEASQVLDGIHK